MTLKKPLTVTMDTATYIPNNPRFGLLQFEWPTVTASTEEFSLDTHQCSQDIQQSTDEDNQINLVTNGDSSVSVPDVSLDLDCCWSSEPDMILGGSAMGFDLEPLPTLFPFSPLGCLGPGQPQDGAALMQQGKGHGITATLYKTESSPATSPNDDHYNLLTTASYPPHHQYYSTTNHRATTEPLPLSTSPCHSHGSSTTPDNINNHVNSSPPHQHHKAGDVAADVLLSLKHAVMHPGDVQGMQCTGNPVGAYVGGGDGYYGEVGGVTGSGGGSGGPYGSGEGAENNPGYQNGQHHHHHHHHHQGSPLFPSMSVNVSMNMTMHGYHTGGNNGNYCPTTTEINYPQVQWTTTPHHQCPHHHHHHQRLLSPPPPPPYNTGTTYSITADFRPAPQISTLDITNNQQHLLTTGNNCAVVGSSATPMVLGRSNLNGAGLSQNQLMIGGGAYKVAGARLSRKGSTLSVVSGGGCYSDGEECEGKERTVSSGSGGHKSNICRICGKSYARPSTLKTHLRTHSGEKPYRCSDCTKSFSQAANLTAHVRTHSGEKPFRCPVCDRRFSQSSSVTTHMRTHSGERPYRCRLCRKAFSDSSTLTKHLRIHSGEKPYECKLCLLRFSQSGNLNRHMRVHNSGTQSSLGVV